MSSCRIMYDVFQSRFDQAPSAIDGDQIDLDTQSTSTSLSPAATEVSSIGMNGSVYGTPGRNFEPDPESAAA
jgi:hypothetical protein